MIAEGTDITKPNGRTETHSRRKGDRAGHEEKLEQKSKRAFGTGEKEVGCRFKPIKS